MAYIFTIGPFTEKVGQLLKFALSEGKNHLYFKIQLFLGGENIPNLLRYLHFIMNLFTVEFRARPTGTEERQERG